MRDESAVDHAISGKLHAGGVDALIARLAGRQSGVVGRRQLLAAGVSRAAIDTRIQRGLLIPVHRGVFAVGHRALTRRGRLWAAVLATGPGAVLSHRTAAELWEVDPGRAEIELTRATKTRARSGLRAYQAKLPADEVRHLSDGLPLTCLPRTLLDLAAIVPARRLQRILEEAERRRIGEALSLPELLARHRGRRGAGRLRRALELWRPGREWTRSELEERFIALVAAAGLPRGEANSSVETATGWLECDYLWRGQRLIVELDGFRYHRTPADQQRDAAKRRALAAAGWRVIVLTWKDVSERPEAIALELRMALEATTGEAAR